jgi:hypothetical protein
MTSTRVGLSSFGVTIPRWLENSWLEKEEVAIAAAEPS